VTVEVPGECWLTPKAEVRPSSIDGRGLFAREPIAAGEVVMRLGGSIISDGDLMALAASGARHDSISLGEGQNLLIEGSHPAIRGNHSCDGNLWMDDAVTISARHDIAPGEELTIDYALLTADKPWRLDCRCGAADCRGTLTEDDWRLAAVQARYAGHFAPFLNARIEALRTA
jgi:hypothetical protein